MFNPTLEATQAISPAGAFNNDHNDYNDHPGNAMQLMREVPLARPSQIQLRFWGTRGSIPVSGPSNLHYGGNTSCVSLTSDTGHLFIFDCGSGARDLGNYLLVPSSKFQVPSSKLPEFGTGVSGYVLLSHSHWDHIQGFPFFGPVFRPGNRFNILGLSNSSQTLSEVLAGQMEQRYFPVSLYDLPSELGFYSLAQQGQCVVLDGATLISQPLKHTQTSVGYRLELNGKAVVYATDHEPLKMPVVEPDSLLGEDVIDQNLVELARNADVLIHDAQYSSVELAEKLGWGHSSAEVAVDTAIKAGVKRLVLFHHDPAHDDAKIDAILAAAHYRAISLGKIDLEIIAACDGMALELS